MYLNTIQQNIGYLNDLKNRINSINHQIFQEKADIENLENQIRDLNVQKENLIKQTEFKIDNLKSKINNLENDIKDLGGQNESLEKEENFKIENKKSQINNLEADVNKLKVETENYIKQKKYAIATLQSQIKDLESQTKYTFEEIQNLEYKKDNVQNIQILKTPTSSPGPNKPKKKLIVLLATMVGLFAMLFLAFVLEYISKNKVQKLSAGWAKNLYKGLRRISIHFGDGWKPLTHCFLVYGVVNECKNEILVGIIWLWHKDSWSYAAK